jgi:hypothetical protein
MILSELKEFMRENRTTNMFYLVTHFSMEPEPIRDMLELLIQKGQVKKVEKDSAHCASCNQCHPLMFEMYEWVELD